VQIKFSVTVFFHLFTFAVAPADVTAVFVNNQHGIQRRRRRQDFDKNT